MPSPLGKRVWDTFIRICFGWPSGWPLFNSFPHDSLDLFGFYVDALNFKAVITGLSSAQRITCWVFISLDLQIEGKGN